MAEWIKREISEGFKRLMCLGLERTPAAEVIQLTVAVWLEALAEGRVWEQERDQPRFPKAFAVLCRTRRAWPMPQDFLDALPPPAEQRRLEKQFVPARPETVAAAAAELGDWLRSMDR